MPKRILTWVLFIVMIFAAIIFIFLSNTDYIAIGLLMGLVVIPFALSSLMKEEDREAIILQKIILLVPGLLPLSIIFRGFKSVVGRGGFSGNLMIGSSMVTFGIPVLVFVLFYLLISFDNKTSSKAVRIGLKLGIWLLWAMFLMTFLGSFLRF